MFDFRRGPKRINCNSIVLMMYEWGQNNPGQSTKIHRATTRTALGHYCILVVETYARVEYRPCIGRDTRYMGPWRNNIKENEIRKPFFSVGGLFSSIQKQFCLLLMRRLLSSCEIGCRFPFFSTLIQDSTHRNKVDEKEASKTEENLRQNSRDSKSFCVAKFEIVCIWAKFSC